MTKRKAAWCVLALCAVLATPSAQAQTKLALGYTAVVDYTSAFIAKEQGFFTREGLDVELTQIANGSTFPGALVSNSLQVGLPDSACRATGQ